MDICFANNGGPIVKEDGSVQPAQVNITERTDGSFRANIHANEGVYIRPEGTGDHTADSGHGWPVLVEIYEGRPVVRIWADINDEDPTHIIPLDGALESNRKGDE
jgi:hypothetical protein|tara:strand:- start:397 stop:711 length:315 start_codon:yes stop_codon:yes gene_type:complete